MKWKRRESSRFKEISGHDRNFKIIGEKKEYHTGLTQEEILNMHPNEEIQILKSQIKIEPEKVSLKWSSSRSQSGNMEIHR